MYNFDENDAEYYKDLAKKGVGKHTTSVDDDLAMASMNKGEMNSANYFNDDYELDVDKIDIWVEAKMIIVVGQFYKLRNELKARIYAVNCGGLFSVHGAVYEYNAAAKGKVWIDKTWREDGKIFTMGDAVQDIVGVWEEPTKYPPLSIWVDADGHVIVKPNDWLHGNASEWKRAAFSIGGEIVMLTESGEK